MVQRGWKSKWHYFEAAVMMLQIFLISIFQFHKIQKKYYIQFHSRQYISPTTHTYSRGRGRGTERRKGEEGKERGKEGGKKRREGNTVFVSFFLLAFLFRTSSFYLLCLDTDLVHNNKWAIYAANAHHQVFSFRKMRVFQ